MEADIGLIGLAVMGQSLVMNLNDRGYRVAVLNRTVAKQEEFLQGAAKGSSIIGGRNTAHLVSVLKRPRIVMLMVKAGEPVDEWIRELLPLLDRGDVIIDGGNSHYLDTERRTQDLAAKGISFMGVGISGGEEGARYGPSIMAGGSRESWSLVGPILQNIAAKASDGIPCAGWVGEGGAGHYVKMVHNGIEYGDMQLICEAYHVLRDLVGCTTEELATIFQTWNDGDLNSYLIEITAHILRFRESDGSFLLDKIVDVAGQKGTGKWTAITAFELGVPVTLIAESVFARYLSSLKEERSVASAIFRGCRSACVEEKKTWIGRVRDALYGAKIVSYAQGFMLLRRAATEMNWNVNLGEVALLWREGCIIRSQFLGDIQKAFALDPKLPILILDPFFRSEIIRCLSGWREVVSMAIGSAIPVPALAAGLMFFDGYTCAQLPTNLLQAQRDCFGAHTYERIDHPRGISFHTQWL